MSLDVSDSKGLSQYQIYDEIRMMRASTLWHCLTSQRQLRHVIKNGCPIPASTTRVGTALHSIVEYLPVDKFRDHFVVRPDFHLFPSNETELGAPSTSRRTTWCKEMEADFDANEAREVLNMAEHGRLIRMLAALSLNADAMSLIINSEREVIQQGIIGNTECKGLVDGICEQIQWNLKSSYVIDQHRFCSHASKLHYPLRDSFHRMLMVDRSEEFKYIVVLDCKPNKEGQYSHAADCVVVNVPIIVMENQEPIIRRLIAEYEHSLATDSWPGMSGYDYEVPSWDMSDEQFEDDLEEESSRAQ